MPISHWKQILLGGAAVVALESLPCVNQAQAQLGVDIINANPNGQSTMASSSPVVLPSNQIVSTNMVQVGGAGVGAWMGVLGGAVGNTAVLMGGEATNGELSNANGALALPMIGLEGKLVVLPHANKENMLRATGSTNLTTAFNLVPAQGVGNKTYITDIECGRQDAGTTAVTVKFNDSATTIIVIPNSGGGGSVNKAFNVPIVTAANATMTMTWSSAISTAYCSVQGYKGT